MPLSSKQTGLRAHREIGYRLVSNAPRNSNATRPNSRVGNRYERRAQRIAAAWQDAGDVERAFLLRRTVRRPPLESLSRNCIGAVGIADVRSRCRNCARGRNHAEADGRRRSAVASGTSAATHCLIKIIFGELVGERGFESPAPTSRTWCAQVKPLESLYK